VGGGERGSKNIFSMFKAKHAKMSMPDLRRYPRNLNLKNFGKEITIENNLLSKL